MSDLLPDEDQRAEQLAQLHDGMIGIGPIDELSNDNPDESIAESARLLQMIRMIKDAASDDQSESPIGTQSRMLEATVEDGSDSSLKTPLPVDFPDTFPHQVGRFKIEEPIGQGGFGIVFRGFDPYLNRPVAIKIPRLDSMLDSRARERFVTEAKAAAALIHPQIVTVFESGEYGPICYLASELVDGSTLADWLSEQSEPISPDAAVRLILSLSDALQHAHSRGIVHRDIKPANILLEHESNGIDEDALARVAKIGDFGLAKIVEDEVSQTVSGSLIGTPAYMSPEQVRSDREAIGKATDIFSLGVLFYELLTLKNPLVRGNLIDTIAAVQKFEPPVPSRINPQVSRDLDAVVMKCMEKKIDNRYPSAADLAKELERILDREPVLARKITFTTRTFRWIDRNRLAATLMVVLLAGLAGTSFGFLRARQSEANARLSEAETRVEAETALQVSEFLEDMFQTVDMIGGKPGQLRGRDVTIEEFLKHGANKIRMELDDQPRVKARLMATIGSQLVKLGDYDEGGALLHDAMSMRLRVLEANDPEIANSHRHLGRLYRLQSKPVDAERELRRAIEIFEMDDVENHRQLSGSLNDLGLLLKSSQPDEALKCYLRAWDLAVAYRPDEREIWRLDANIAALHGRAGQFEIAKERFERALQNGITFHGNDTHPALGAILSNLAFVHRKLGNLHRARDLQEQGLLISEQQLGAQHPSVGTSLIGLATVCQALGDYENALDFGQRALEITQTSLPPENEMIGFAINTHAITNYRLQNYSAARELIQKAIERLEGRSDEGSIASQMRNLLLLSNIERQDGNLDLALEIVNEVLSNPVTDHNPATGMDARFAKAMVLAQSHDDQAEEIFRDSLEFANLVPGLKPKDRAYFVARYQSLLGNDEEALAQLEQAIQLGFRDASLLTDPDLDGIRDDPRFSKLGEQVKDLLAQQD